MIMKTIVLVPGDVTLAQLRQIAAGGVKIALDPACYDRITRAADTIQTVLDRGESVYGINTGFGLMAKTRIDADSLRDLQRNLVLSHSTGTGAPVSDAVARLIIALKVTSLAAGHSGIRAEVIDHLVTLFNHGVYPMIPEKGSVGASGDLAPLAHMSLSLIGEGEVRHHGEVISAIEGLKRAGLEPVELGPKEGLALLNGTQVSTALTLSGLFAIEDVFAAAVLSGSVSVDAAKGSDTPFDPRIHELRRQPGQIAVAAKYRELLADSEIRRSHVDCERVQDPYSLRCQPQVMGACLDQINHAAAILEREANAVTDNPLIFPDDGDILSGGNFHAEPVAFAADILAIAASEIGAISERRIALLIDPAMVDLPAFLVENGGLNSGFMIAQVTAAALASENKTLAHPASIDSLPTSANQEDHVSMATFAGRRLADIADNVNGIIAIEMLAACQGIEFRRPMTSSDKLEKIIGAVRSVAKFYDRDRYFAPDIAAVKGLLKSPAVHGYLDDLLPSFA
jgi:histidine ammonia-lyase